MKTLRSVFCFLTGISAIALAVYYQKTLPPIANPLGIVIILPVLLGFGAVVNRWFMRNRFGMLLPSGVFLFASVGYFTSAIFGGVFSAEGQLLILAVLGWIALYGKPGVTLFAFALIILPESLGWLNQQSFQFSLIPVPIAEIEEDLSPRVFWAQYFIRVFPVFMVPLAFSFLRRKAFAKQTIAPVAAKSAISRKSASNSSGHSEEADLRKLEADNAALKQKAVVPGEGNLGGILESIVYFLSKNFGAQTALGFLSIDGGRTFVLNAKFTRSKALKSDILIYPGSGIVGKAILEGGSFMSGNVSSYPDVVEYYSAPGQVNSILISAIRDEKSQRMQGLLVVDSTAMRAYTDTHKELMTRFSNVASKLISNVMLSRELQRSGRQQELLYEISKKLSAQKYTRGIISVLIEHLLKAVEADRVVVCDFDSRSGKGRVIQVGGNTGVLKRGFLFDIDDPRAVYGKAFLTKKSVLESNLPNSGNFRFVSQENPSRMPQELLVVPLLNDHQQCVAVVGLESHVAGKLHPSSQILVETALTTASAAFTRAQLFGRMEKQATMDGLTKIPNHRCFQDNLTKMMEQAQQTGLPMSLLLMDIDHFKNFNDTYGHPLGDKVLQEVARALRNATRETDFPARYGGEEFVVILSESDEDTAIGAAERIRQNIEAIRVPFQDKILSVTVSIGSATMPQDTQKKQQLIDMADRAMYHSKEAGRNRSTPYHSLPSSEKL